jgi:hypothetical protein
VSRSASQRSAQAGQEAVFAAAVDDEAGHALQAAADRAFRDGELTAVEPAGQRIGLVGRADEFAVVQPLPLDELELPVQMRTHEREHQAAVRAVIVLHAGGQRRAVVGAAPDHLVQAHLAGDNRVSGVHPPGVGAGRALQTPRVIAVQERVVALPVGAKLGIVLVRG